MARKYLATLPLAVYLERTFSKLRTVGEYFLSVSLVTQLPSLPTLPRLLLVSLLLSSSFLRAIINREKARIWPEYPGPGAPIREKPGLVRGPLKGLLGKALLDILNLSIY